MTPPLACESRVLPYEVGEDALSLSFERALGPGGVRVLPVRLLKRGDRSSLGGSSGIRLSISGSIRFVKVAGEDEGIGLVTVGGGKVC